MRDQTPKTINNVGHNIVINLHPTNGVHWFLVINRDNTKSYYFDRFGVETMPTFLELKQCQKNNKLGSDKRIQE